MSNQSKNNDQNRLVEFSVDQDGLYAITVTATCHKNQDLRVEIDGRVFRELPSEKYTQKFNVPAAFNGAKLKGKTQTNIFILNLNKGQHKLNFIAQNGAEITNWQLQKIDNPSEIIFNLNLQAQNYNRQPLLNIILVDLELFFIKADVSLAWHKKSFFRGDSDDVKLIIDSEIITDNKAPWLWRAVKEQKTAIKTITKKVTPNLDADIHYVEFWADQSPIIKSVALGTVIQYKGDYRCHATIRQPYGKDKEVLGIYIPSKNPGEINNDNVELYFNDARLSLGVNKEAMPWQDIFDLNTTIDQNGNWFFYGIDTSWRNKHPDWRDDEKWRIVKN